ncbi:type 2 periplasmic-binding domain-containing protein [Tannockella kyphosi]|uniref:hypothetical protein n=1 Tax=Tannockella kyphosi TaxID=2899121 RepID=UPI002011710F|nr:hypothetical protein [Tannockella kyphosi]
MKKIYIITTLFCSILLLSGCSDDTKQTLVIYAYNPFPDEQISTEQIDAINDYLDSLGKDYEVEYREVVGSYEQLLDVTEYSQEMMDDMLINGTEYYVLKEDYSTTQSVLESQETVHLYQMGYFGFDDIEETNLVDAGLVINLEEILETEQGQVIYDSYPELVWDSIKIDEEIYSIPSLLNYTVTNAMDSYDSEYYYLAFNKEMCDELGLDPSSWDYKIYEHGDELIDALNQLSTDVLYETFSSADFQSIFPYLTPLNGTFDASPFVVDERTGTIELLIDCQEYVAMFEFFDEIREGVTNYPSNSYVAPQESVTPLFEVGVYKTNENSDDYYFIENDSYYLNQLTYRSTAIASSNDNMEDTLDYLYLLSSDETLVSLLLAMYDDGTLGDYGLGNSYLIEEDINNLLTTPYPENFSVESHSEYLETFELSTIFNQTICYDDYLDELLPYLPYHYFLIPGSYESSSGDWIDVDKYNNYMDIDLLYEIRDYLNLCID